MLRAPITITQGLATYSARSEFTTESGAITGDALTVGGTWVGAGDAVDFSVAAGVATRSEPSDAGTSVNGGRLITASTPTLTTTVAQIESKVSALDTSGALRQGLLLRYTDISNYLAVVLSRDTGAQGPFVVSVIKRVSGVNTTLIQETIGVPVVADTWITLNALATASGDVVAAVGAVGAAPTAVVTISDSALATGGSLASGKVGLVDWYASASPALTRSYRNFIASSASLDAVCFASQSVELSTQGITREDSTGTAYGPVSIVNGDLPRMPNRSSGGTVEFVGKLSRGDMESTPDPSIDDVSVRVYRRASHLLLPN